MRQQRQFEKAEEELIAYFTSATAIRGQSYERNGDGTDDPDRVERGLIDELSRNEWHTHEKVGITLELVSERTRTNLARAYAPRRHVSGLPRKELFITDKTKKPIEDMWGRIAAEFGRYAGVAPFTEAAVRGYRRSARGNVVALAPTHTDILEYFERTLSEGRSFPRAIKDEVNATVRAALLEYEMFRGRRAAAEKELKEAREKEIRGVLEA